MEKLLAAYRSQKNAARRRGIEFKLTFELWLAFWGNDVARRGRKPDQLQMQRFGDQGAYEVGNIKKGTPKQNALTAGLIKQSKASASRAVRHQANLDALMCEESADDRPMDEDAEELAHLGYACSFDRQYSFVADKDR